MILPEVELTYRANEVSSVSGIDALPFCFDKKHFTSFPYQVEYRFNSRGFRDTEWPDTMEELNNCFWCFGDSFTSGVGSPQSHTWVSALQQKTGNRCINVSMDGASNDWIARKVLEVLSVLSPKAVFIQWSYLQRGESSQIHLSDEKRRVLSTYMSLDKQYDNFITNFNNVNTAAASSSVMTLHSIIPQQPFYTSDAEAQTLWNMVKGDSWPVEFPKTRSELLDLQKSIMSELKNSYLHTYDSLCNVCFMKEHPSGFNLVESLASGANFIKFKQIDIARDGHHYGIKTADTVAEKFLMLLRQTSSDARF
jgi:hypothetical protein